MTCDLALRAPPALPYAGTRRRLRAGFEAAGTALFALFLFFTCFTFLRPSPYDFAAIPTVLLWFALGIRLHRGAVPLAALLLIYHAALVVALVPYLDEPDPVEWTVQALYLCVTGFFFVMFFSDRTRARAELGLRAYVASALFASVCGVVAFFQTPGSEFLFRMDGRAAGVFEDPNLLGSFLIPALLYLARGLLVGDARRPVPTALALLLVAGAEFLSFSRGAWGAALVGLAAMAVMAYATEPGAAVRRRIVRAALVTGFAGGLGLGALLSVGEVAEVFTNRAKVTQDYDEGETGRFGNQLRSLPMLVERPAGFGPLRFRLVFSLEPHNSYIGAFANGGWVGGVAFLGLVLTTACVGFRLCLTASPYRRLAQVAWPALLVLYLQAFQIDVEKWRQTYFLLGLVWALEVARRRWLAERAAGHPA